MSWGSLRALRVVLLFCTVLQAQSQTTDGKSNTCPNVAPPCDPMLNPILYPVSFGVFGAFPGQVFTVGQFLVIVARFAEDTCNLLQPKKVQSYTNNSKCVPLLTISLNSTTNNKGSCWSIPAARSANDVQTTYSISFADDDTLHRVVGLDNATYWNHWVFPVPITSGMSSEWVRVLSLTIPQDCNFPSKGGRFYQHNLIPSDNALLQPKVSVDTTRPVIMNIYTSKPPGTYTAGDCIYIVFDFSREVAFSQLPDPYSQVRLRSRSE
jgi:hypothetical protein